MEICSSLLPICTGNDLSFLEMTSYSPSYGRCNGPRCALCLTNTCLVLMMLSGTHDLGAVCAVYIQDEPYYMLLRHVKLCDYR